MAGVVTQTVLSGGVAVSAYSAFSGVKSLAGVGYTMTPTDGYNLVQMTSAPSNLTFSSRSGNVITFTGAHGLLQATPIYFNGSGTPPTGLTLNKMTWFIPITATSGSFSTSPTAGSTITLSSNGSGTRTWAPGVALVLPDATACAGRVITVARMLDRSAQLINIVTVSSQLIGRVQYKHLAGHGCSVTLMSNGTGWVPVGPDYESFYSLALVEGDIASGYIFAVKTGAMVQLEMQITMDGAIGTSGQQNMTSIINQPNTITPMISNYGGIVNADTSTEHLHRILVSTSGTVSFSPIAIDTNGLLAQANAVALATYKGTVSYTSAEA